MGIKGLDAIIDGSYLDPEAKECGFMGCGRAQCENLCTPTPKDGLCIETE